MVQCEIPEATLVKGTPKNGNDCILSKLSRSRGNIVTSSPPLRLPFTLYFIAIQVPGSLVGLHFAHSLLSDPSIMHGRVPAF